MKKQLLIICSILFFANLSIGQTTVAKIKYEEAEEAYSKEDYQAILPRLEEAEKLFGKINPPILYLRIMTQHMLLDDNPHNSPDLLLSLKKNCATYLKSYEKIKGIEDKYREVYQVSENLAIYSGNANFLKARSSFYGIGGMAKDSIKGLAYCKKAITEGDSHAMNLMGFFYFQGWGVEKNVKKEMEWYQKAADKGNVFALNNLAIESQTGNEFLAKDNTKTVSYNARAANMGFAPAMNDLAWVYRLGEIVPKNQEKAFDWFKKSAAKNNSSGMHGLGLSYYNGAGVEKSFTSAAEWFDRSAKRNNSSAMFFLATLYKEGEGVEKSLTRYKELMTKAAENGHVSAMYLLGLRYSIEDNDQLAAEWYEKAAEGGDKDAPYELARLYDGNSALRDEKKALKWYAEAAKLENYAAMKKLGGFYRDGLAGLTKDHAKAMEYFQKAAANGEIAAFVDIGDMYKNGNGVAMDYAKALDYYNKALIKENWVAKPIGDLYLEGGPGIEKDVKTAITWYRKGAEKDAGSALALQKLYETGNGVKKSQKRADEWKRVAASLEK